MSGLNVYAVDGTTYSGYSKVSDAYGNAVFYLPSGDYRFRADRDGTQFWSSDENDPSGEGTCTIPGCENVIISVTLSVTVNVVDTDGTPQEGLNVYAFDDETYSNYSKVTDENGQAVFSLPEGDYHFRTDLNGTQFWSNEENSCTLPGCISDNVTVTKPVTVTVAGEEGNPYADLNVYVFNGETYAGYSGKTDAGGHVTFTLPQGDYHFRADFDGVQFWSGNENTCTIPGCEEDAVTLPGGTGEQEVSIDYTYDALNRLISVEYSNGTAFGYTYDAAGNVLTYAETHYGQTTVTTYKYDAANQLLTATEDETVWQYSYNGNGSLIQTNPGAEVANGSTRYTYNTAGYLTKVENYTTEWQTQSEMTYDGLGNRLEVTTYTDGEGNTTRYVLDGGTTLTEIGAERSTFYLYGRGVIGTLGESWNYILSDGAGSTRQLVDEEGAVTLSISYTPWGDTMEIYGSGMLNLGYLGGVYDAGTGLIYMGNGQYYDPSTGRFLTRGMNEASTNPYTPWNSDPAGMLIAPLALLALVFGRKKTRTKFDQFVILFVIVLSVGLSVMVFGGSFTVQAKPANSNIELRVPTPIPGVTPTATTTSTSTPAVLPPPTSANISIYFATTQQNNGNSGSATAPANTPTTKCTWDEMLYASRKIVSGIGGQYSAVYWNNLTQTQLGDVSRNQYPRNDCAIYAIAAAFNHFAGKQASLIGTTVTYGYKYSGKQMSLEIDAEWNNRQQNRKRDYIVDTSIRTYPNFATLPFEQVEIVDYYRTNPNASFTVPYTASITSNDKDDMITKLSDINKLQIVTIYSYSNGKYFQPELTRDGFQDPSYITLGGHTMLLVAYDPTHYDYNQEIREWGFVNSWKDASSSDPDNKKLYWMSNQDLELYDVVEVIK